MGNMGIYNEGTESVSGSTDWQNRMSRECLARRPYPRDTRKTQLSPAVQTLRIPVMCKVYASLRGKLSRETLARILLVSLA